jgi:hypothetical protein
MQNLLQYFKTLRPPPQDSTYGVRITLKKQQLFS